MRFTVLASGSSGNACLLESEGFGLLIDAGLGPRQLQARLHAIGVSERRIRAAVLTHIHGDHCNEHTLRWLHRQGIRLFCHAEHRRTLMLFSEAFAALRRAGLVCEYECAAEIQILPALRCLALPVSHDHFTCGFRFEGSPNLFGQAFALAYACDLGSWDEELLQGLRNVDILALEFNHDADLQRTSGRPRHLIRRVLGAEGHLSNEQAGALLQEIVRESEPGRLRHLVQLHLSQQCNRPKLAAAAARRMLADCQAIRIHTAHPHRPGPRLSL